MTEQNRNELELYHRLLALPEEAHDRLVSLNEGERIWFSRLIEHGLDDKVRLRVRIGIEDDRVRLSPVYNRPVLPKDLRPHEIEQLLSGNPIPARGFARGLGLWQLDRDTKGYRVFRVGQEALAELPERLHEAVAKVNPEAASHLKHIELGREQRERILLGKPVEVTVDNTKLTVGADINAPAGKLRIINGSMDDWHRMRMEEHDRVHPEVMGWLQTDQNRWEYTQIHAEAMRSLQLQTVLERGLAIGQEQQKARGLSR